MLLRKIEIKNYRSLGEVELSGLSKFNVLIGKNNSGKSSVLNALLYLSNSIIGGSSDTSVITGQRPQTSLEFRLLFDAGEEDRKQLIRKLDLNDERTIEITNSPFCRQIEFFLQSAPGGHPLHLTNVSMIAEDNEWAVIQKIRGDRAQGNPVWRTTRLEEVAGSSKALIGKTDLDLDNSPPVAEMNVNSNFQQQDLRQLGLPAELTVKMLGSYLGRAFFFSPFRHSGGQMAVTQTTQLNQDGSNLPQVLHTINSNDRVLFASIEKFIHSALPNIGTLLTPLTATNTEVAFRPPEGGYLIRLHEMGGGIEQLLMVATVLLTSSGDTPLFLEEPESHLHPGAQRFIIERLVEGNQQVFVTTHSPSFINTKRGSSIYQVQLLENRTSITHYRDTDSLSDLLEDIGSRNSDVLLSDAVLFVEGPGDSLVISVWAEKLRSPLAENNITVLPMDGCEHSRRKIRPRTELLRGISLKAPVPHLFLLDRDERSRSELNDLEEALGDRVHLLRKRELENYLLSPKALLAAIRLKHIDDGPIVERIDNAALGQVNRLIQTEAESLRPLVLIKRVRAELGGLKDGLLPREVVPDLLRLVDDERFPTLLREKIEKRFSQHLTNLDIEALWAREKSQLEREWAEPENHLSLAPGEELVSAVFRHFGAEYAKPKDTLRIALAMNQEEIDQEIADFVQQVVNMTRNSHRS